MSLIPRAEALAGRSAAMRKPKAPEANRARIVKAAIDEFAGRGFKGASMDAIAARTHTTRALINYYFGSKEKLYLSVLEDVYSEIRQAEGELDLDHLAPVAAMRSLNRPIIDTLGRVIRRGQRDGGFRAGIDPVDVHMMIAALGMFNVTNQYTFGAIFQRDMGAKGDVRRRRERVAEMILAYLRKTD